MQTLKKTTAVLIVAAVAWLGGACEEAPDTPTQPLPPSFSHSGHHSGTYTVWSLNEHGLRKPLETLADVTNMTGRFPTGPVLVTAMTGSSLPGGACGILYWHPTTNRFAYVGVTNGTQLALDLDSRPMPSTGQHGSFGGGNTWGTVFQNEQFAPYVLFAGTNNVRAYNVGSRGTIGIRVSMRTGKVYAADVTNMKVIELDPATNAVRKWHVGNRPFFLTLDELDRVYMTAAGSGPDEILRLDPATNEITRWRIPGGGLANFVGNATLNYITRDREETVWFSEPISNELGRLNPVTNVFEEFTKPGIAGPDGIATSGAGPTLQVYAQERDGNTTDILTRVAASPLVTVVTPTVTVVPPELSTASFVDLVRPRTDLVITPTTTTVTSSNGNGIDRFPQPPGVFRPTSVTPVVVPNTIFGSVEGSDDVEQFVSTLIVAPPPPPPVGEPATLVLDPKAATNPVDSRHCVTAAVRDASGNPVEGVVVRFMVTGSVNTSGSATTDANGEARFCYDGPPLPGADVIQAFADTDSDGMQDPGEPFDEATKTWMLPVTTPLCEIKITQGGWIIAQNGDRASFGGNAKSDDAGETQGQENYQDHGPAQPMDVHSINVLAIVCEPSGQEADIYGQATVDGAGSFFYRIKVRDLAEPGDTYWLMLSNGYNSGDQRLQGGNVQIHKD